MRQASGGPLLAGRGTSLYRAVRPCPNRGVKGLLDSRVNALESIRVRSHRALEPLRRIAAGLGSVPQGVEQKSLPYRRGSGLSNRSGSRRSRMLEAEHRGVQRLAAQGAQGSLLRLGTAGSPWS